MTMVKLNYHPAFKELGSLLDNVFGRQLDDASFVESSTWTPAVDIKEDQERFLILADLPGVSKDEIQISLENNVVTLRGERRFATIEGENTTRKERIQGKFYRRFSLPQIADDANIAAKYKQGVLQITIPKKEMVKEKSIAIPIDE